MGTGNLTHNLISFKLFHITFLIMTPARDAHHLVLLSNMGKGWLYPRHCPSLFTMKKEMVLREQSPTWNSIREYRITSSYNHTKAHHSLIGIKWSMTDTLHDFRHHTDLFLAVFWCIYIYMCLPADTHCTACSWLLPTLIVWKPYKTGSLLHSCPLCRKTSIFLCDYSLHLIDRLWVTHSFEYSMLPAKKHSKLDNF